MRLSAPRRLLFLPLLALFSQGCEAPGGSPEATAPTVTDSAGVQVVRFPGAALEVQSSRQLAREPSVRIGVVEGPDEYQWTRPTAAVRLADGSFAVAESTPAEIRIFSPEGTFLRRIGRPGDGPGEFRNPQALTPDPEGGVLAWDARARRRSHFDARGALLSETTLQELSPLRSLVRTALLPDGRLVVVGGTEGPEALSNRGAVRESLRIHGVDEEAGLPASGSAGARARGSASLRVGPLLGTVAGDEREIVTESDAGGGLMSINIASQWYWGRLYTAPSPEGVWVADRVGMEARLLRSEGGLVQVIRVDARGTRVTRALTDSLEVVEMERWARQMGDDLTPEIRTMIRGEMASREYPEFLPAMDALFADAWGNPWIGLPNPPSPPLFMGGPSQVSRWLVFGGADGASGIQPDPGGPLDSGPRRAPELHLRGVIHLPAGSHPLWADDEGVLLLRIDPELGVPYIEWYGWV